MYVIINHVFHISIIYMLIEQIHNESCLVIPNDHICHLNSSFKADRLFSISGLYLGLYLGEYCINYGPRLHIAIMLQRSPWYPMSHCWADQQLTSYKGLQPIQMRKQRKRGSFSKEGSRSSHVYRHWLHHQVSGNQLGLGVLWVTLLQLSSSRSFLQGGWNELE